MVVVVGHTIVQGLLRETRIAPLQVVRVALVLLHPILELVETVGRRLLTIDSQQALEILAHLGIQGLLEILALLETLALLVAHLPLLTITL